MPMIVECDGGCGAKADGTKEFREFGIAKKVYYCPHCAVLLDALYEARNRAHAEYAGALNEALMLGIVEFRKNLPNGTLPDEPD